MVCQRQQPYKEAGQTQNANDAKKLDKVTTPTQFQDPNGFFHTTIFEVMMGDEGWESIPKHVKKQ